MLWTIFVVLLILWLLGFSLHVGGGLIHVLLLDADGHPLGVLNARDGLRALLAAGNHEEALLRNYVMGIGYQ